MKTDPSSPAVGVNVGAVDQTVTFANGERGAAVIVPILSGAPNPGEVDVSLTITPLNDSPNVTVVGPLELRILASTTIPPKIVSVTGKPQGIVLTFSKPMNPVEASNVKNYALRWKSIHSKYNLLGPAALLLPWSSLSSSTSGSARLKSARYDPATNSVTLIPNGKLSRALLAGTQSSITVTQGHPAKISGRPGKQSNVGPGLTDLEGNPINADSTPGKFNIDVFSGQSTFSTVTGSWDSCYRPIAELPLIIVIRTASITLTALTCDNPPGDVGGNVRHQSEVACRTLGFDVTFSFGSHFNSSRSDCRNPTAAQDRPCARRTLSVRGPGYHAHQRWFGRTVTRPRPRASIARGSRARGPAVREMDSSPGRVRPS